MSIIPQGLFDKYDEFTQHFLDDFGATCTLHYSNLVETVNQSMTPLKKKNSIDFLTGDHGFSRGDTAYKTVSQTDTIRLRIYWTQDEFKKIANLVLPQGSIATYGLLSDLHKIERADKLTIYPSLTPDHREWICERIGEPILHGLTHKEFICFWGRVNG